MVLRVKNCVIHRRGCATIGVELHTVCDSKSYGIVCLYFCYVIRGLATMRHQATTLNI